MYLDSAAAAASNAGTGKKEAVVCKEEKIKFKMDSDKSKGNLHMNGIIML
jgi:hypothetical protein